MKANAAVHRRVGQHARGASGGGADGEPFADADRIVSEAVVDGDGVAGGGGIDGGLQSRAAAGDEKLRGLKAGQRAKEKQKKLKMNGIT